MSSWVYSQGNSHGFGNPSATTSSTGSSSSASGGATNPATATNSNGFTAQQQAAVDARNQRIADVTRQYNDQIAGLQEQRIQTESGKRACDDQKANADIQSNQQLSQALSNADQQIWSSLGPTLGQAVQGLTDSLGKKGKNQEAQREALINNHNNKVKQYASKCGEIPSRVPLSASADAAAANVDASTISGALPQQSAQATAAGINCAQQHERLFSGASNLALQLSQLDRDDQANGSALGSLAGAAIPLALGFYGAGKQKDAAKDGKEAQDELSQRNYNSCLANIDDQLAAIDRAIARAVASRDSDINSINDGFALPPRPENPQLASDNPNIQQPVTVDPLTTNGDNVNPFEVSGTPTATIPDATALLSGQTGPQALNSLSPGGGEDGGGGGGGGGGSGGGGGGGAGKVPWTFSSGGGGIPGGGGLPSSLKPASKTPGGGGVALAGGGGFGGGGVGFEDPFANNKRGLLSGQYGGDGAGGPLGDGGLKVLINKMQRITVSHLKELLDQKRKISSEIAGPKAEPDSKNVSLAPVNQKL